MQKGHMQKVAVKPPGDANAYLHAACCGCRHHPHTSACSTTHGLVRQGENGSARVNEAQCEWYSVNG